MLKMVDGTGIIGLDMVCPLGVSTPQPPNYDRVEMEGTGMLVLPNSLDAPLDRLELGGKTEQVQTSGKNLFNREKAKDESNWKHISGYKNYPIYVGTGNKVTFSYLEKLNTGLPLYFGVGFKESSISEYMYHAATPSLIANKKTLTATGDYAYLIVSESNVPAFLDAIQTFQVEISPTQTSYEPYTGGKPSPSPEYPQEIKNVGKWNEETQKYEVDVKITNAEQNWSKEQTLTITSDRPITKWDRLVEQGGEYGWLYGTKKYTVTGSENYIFGGAQYYSGISTNMYINAVKNMSGEGVCRRLKSIIGIWDKSNNTKDGFCINSGNQIHMRFFNNLLGVSDDATMEEKKAAYIAYLKKEYEKGTPYEIVYQSLEPEFVPLPQSEQNAIRALKTYYPTTVITADGGELDPDIKVTYRKEI